MLSSGISSLTLSVPKNGSVLGNKELKGLLILISGIRFLRVLFIFDYSFGSSFTGVISFVTVGLMIMLESFNESRGCCFKESA